MERSGSQKVLRILSIISIIFAVLSIIMAILVIVGGSSFESLGLEAIEGMSAAETGTAILIVGVMSLIDGIISLIMGILGLRASNDAAKIMPVWVISIISFISSLISLISVIMNKPTMSDICSEVISLACAAFMVWIANNIKNQRDA